MAGEKTKIYVAVVHHRHGVNWYAARSQDGMLAQVADYCRQEWEGEHVPGKPPKRDETCVSRYFAAVSSEYWESEEGVLED